jgi:hypothetical protein
MDYARRFEKNRYDPSRLQATLFLSEKGRDYASGGFRFETNQGKTIGFGDEIAVAPGDLVIWRYNNLHSVENVASASGQFGFMRIIYPPEDVAAMPPATPQVGKAPEAGPLRRTISRVKETARRWISKS